MRSFTLLKHTEIFLVLGYLKRNFSKVQQREMLFCAIIAGQMVESTLTRGIESSGADIKS